jgi:hypothetical protein
MKIFIVALLLAIGYAQTGFGALMAGGPSEYIANQNNCPVGYAYCAPLRRCVEVTVDTILEQCLSEIDLPEWSCEDFKAQPAVCKAHERFCYWSLTDGCKDKENKHMWINGGGDYLGFVNDIIDTGIFPADINPLTPSMFNNFDQSVFDQFDPTMISQVDTNLVSNLEPSQAVALWTSVVGPTVNDNCGIGRASCMGICVSIFSDTFLEECNSEQDLQVEFDCELFETSKMACEIFSQYCYFGMEGCKTREDKELWGYPKNPINPAFNPGAGQSSGDAGVSTDTTGAADSGSFADSGVTSDANCASPSRWCPPLNQCILVGADEFLEECHSEADYPNCEQSPTGDNQQLCVAKSYCYWSLTDGCKDKEGPEHEGAGLGLNLKLPLTQKAETNSHSMVAVYAVVAFFSSLIGFLAARVYATYKPNTIQGTEVSLI